MSAPDERPMHKLDDLCYRRRALVDAKKALEEFNRKKEIEGKDLNDAVAALERDVKELEAKSVWVITWNDVLDADKKEMSFSNAVRVAADVGYPFACHEDKVYHTMSGVYVCDRDVVE